MYAHFNFVLRVLLYTLAFGQLSHSGPTAPFTSSYSQLSGDNHGLTKRVDFTMALWKGSTYKAKIREEPGWTKQTIKDFAQAGYNKIKDRFTGGAVLVAALWIHGDGCYIVSKPRGDAMVDFMFANRLTAPAWNSYNEERTDPDLEDRFHAEDGACFYVENRLPLSGKVPAGGNYEEISGGIRPFIAIYGKYRSSDKEGFKPPCGGGNADPPCTLEMSWLHIDYN